MKLIDYCHLAYLIWYFFRCAALPFICSSDGANEFCEASLPCGIAKARKREAKFSCNCCILLSLVLFQSQLHRVPGAGRSSQLRQSTLCWSSEVKKCQHQPKLQKCQAQVPYTGRPEPAGAFICWAQWAQPWVWRTTCNISRQHRSWVYACSNPPAHLFFAQLQSSTQGFERSLSSETPARPTSHPLYSLISSFTQRS